MPFFRNYFVTLGANSVHGAQENINILKYTVMTEQQKQDIIESGKQYFRSIIIPNHLKNLNKLHLSSFDINPFLINYLAAFLCRDTQPISLAKALVYPRILGTSLSTSFGQNVQVFIAQLQEVVGGASGIDGIDIEFVDAIDGRRKYCQCKAGPKQSIRMTLPQF